VQGGEVLFPKRKLLGKCCGRQLRATCRKKTPGLFPSGHLRRNPGVTASEKFVSYQKTQSLNNLSWETEKHKCGEKEKSWDGGRGKST